MSISAPDPPRSTGLENGKRHSGRVAAGVGGPDVVSTGPDALGGRYLRRLWQPVATRA